VAFGLALALSPNIASAAGQSTEKEGDKRGKS